MAIQNGVFVFFFVVSACHNINYGMEQKPLHIVGLEDECACIDDIYKELERLTREGQEVVYVNKRGVFENSAHQLNIYKFCYDVNGELTVDQKSLLAHYHVLKAYDVFGRVIREVPYEQPLYDQCARQTGMVIETIACALTPRPECHNILTGIAAIYASIERIGKSS